MNTDPSGTPTPPVRRTLPPGPSQRIFVAEQDEETLDLIVSAFVEDGWDAYGMDGETALAECLEIIAHHALRPPDLIVVGVGMAWHSGIDLVEAVRSAGFATPVVLLTWSIPTDLRLRIERAGAAALVRKPFNVTELRSAVRRARASLHAGPVTIPSGTDGRANAASH